MIHSIQLRWKQVYHNIITFVSGAILVHCIFFSAPSAPPEHMYILNTTLFTITVGWDEVPCNHRNGNITEYRIMYNAQDSIVVFDVSVSGTSATISDLQSDTEYYISVAAVNTAGVGSYRTISGKTLT